MAAHFFTVSEGNYKICVEKGLVAIPEADGKMKDNINDGLISRLTGIKEDDYVFLYVMKSKSIHGVWQIEGAPFYDETQVWADNTYPFRCKIKCTQFNFPNSLRRDDILDLQSAGKIWTLAFKRATGTNSMFSISNEELQIILTEFVKKNPFSAQKTRIMQPYPFHEGNIIQKLHFFDGKPKYESTIMALLNAGFAKGDYTEIFGNYSDFLCYVPTSLEKEMDFLLIFDNPFCKGQIVSYDIIEVKREEFDISALTQLISYESWFLQKKISGDSNMLRTTAIAKTFSDDVIQYVKQRKQIENKPIKLLRYFYENAALILKDVLQSEY